MFVDGKESDVWQAGKQKERMKERKDCYVYMYDFAYAHKLIGLSASQTKEAARSPIVLEGENE